MSEYNEVTSINQKGGIPTMPVHIKVNHIASDYVVAVRVK